MSQEERESGKFLPQVVVYTMLSKNFEKLPHIEQQLFNLGPFYLAGNGAFAGLIANSLFRRALHVTQARIVSSLPMAVLPAVGTWGLYNSLLSTPLLYGNLNCPSCAPLRGALVGVICGAAYPIILALPMNIGLAALYQTAPMPAKENLLRYWMDLSRPVLRKMRAVMVLQAFFGAYLGSRNFNTYLKLVDITFGPQGED